MRKFRSKCYDCSGSVSYALHGGRFLSRPMDSGDLMHWGRGRKGKWITVYSNPGHAYMMVAGLRFDTSMTRGKGPGWSKRKRSELGLPQTSQEPLLTRLITQSRLPTSGGSVSG